MVPDRCPRSHAADSSQRASPATVTSEPPAIAQPFIFFHSVQLLPARPVGAQIRRGLQLGLHHAAGLHDFTTKRVSTGGDK